MGDSNAKKGPILGGLTLSSLKKNYPLIPLFVAVVIGVAGATFYTCRLAFRNPDVTWSLKKNPEPWQEYRDKQYKFYSTVNYDEYASKAPKF
ncbi:cytochrome c oxidase subunit NDUFA4-like [Vespa mandarinia]|uniref:cytochrome c oxidase subunit NDUFA4-like n=1 Tax=Vespa mandarinia TaxID=7446 RepID=UPI00160880CA|nr:cytochrome c oxidase subunit NDUFA4-like [Vespa mandarinia]XP_046830505.1 cytochrome c oxidase subunit NDUFA4 [Vespa crabro]